MAQTKNLPLPTAAVKNTLLEQARALARSEVTSERLVDEALCRIADPQGEGRRTFLKVRRERALADARAQDRLRNAGVKPTPLTGIPVSIKDLFDVTGETTSAASTVLADAPPAREDAAVVRTLRTAGAVIVGRTNMSEFAFSALGLKPHHGTPRNPFDRATGRLPGGSSSGAAVSVSDGMATIGIGTDTGGSVRIPAALCGLAGFKPTQARVSLQGVFPLSPTFDSVGPIAPSVACCALVNAVLASADHALPPATDLSELRFGLLDYATERIDERVGKSFERALSVLSARRCRFVQLHFAELDDLPGYFLKGGLSSVQAFAWHKELLAQHSQRYDPRIAHRILLGKDASSEDCRAMLAYRARLVWRSTDLLARCDALLMPTVPITAPAIDGIQDDPTLWARINQLLFSNTVIANLIDGCAVTMPCHGAGEAPVGLMLVNGHGEDVKTLRMGIAVENAFKPDPGNAM